MSNNNEELIGLLARSAVGDQNAFSRLYEHTAPRLYGVCLRLLRQRELAEEVLQEVYVRIWHQAPEYTPERGTVMTWMATIARYRAIDTLRRHARRPEAPLDEGIARELSDTGAGPLEATAAGGEAAALERCLGELSETQRDAIGLAFFQGLTHEEVGERLQSPLGTVKSWIRRGLQSLKRCLGVES